MKKPAQKCLTGNIYDLFRFIFHSPFFEKAFLFLIEYWNQIFRWSIMVFEKEIEAAAPHPAERPRRMSTISNPTESILLDFVDTVNGHLSQIVDTDDFSMVVYSAKHLCDTIYKLLSRVMGNNLTDDQMQAKCDILRFVGVSFFIPFLRVFEPQIHFISFLVKSISALISRFDKCTHTHKHAERN